MIDLLTDLLAESGLNIGAPASPAPRLQPEQIDDMGIKIFEVIPSRPTEIIAEVEATNAPVQHAVRIPFGGTLTTSKPCSEVEALPCLGCEGTCFARPYWQGLPFDEKHPRRKGKDLDTCPSLERVRRWILTGI